MFDMLGNPLSFEILSVGLHVGCTDPELRALIQANWGHMESPTAAPDIVYSVTATGPPQRISIVSPGQQEPLLSADLGEFLYDLEKEITIELQLRRADLFFLHAAAAEFKGRACLLIAESGGGKSTTLWALLHHDFAYLSDELAPLDLTSLSVHPYQHALCLKRPPPAPYALPPGTVSTPHTLHVPVDLLPGRAADECHRARPRDSLPARKDRARNDRGTGSGRDSSPQGRADPAF